MGLSPEGINREVASTIEWANLCKYTPGRTLAIPETVVYNLASRLPVNKFLRVRVAYWEHRRRQEGNT